MLVGIKPPQPGIIDALNLISRTGIALIVFASACSGVAQSATADRCAVKPTSSLVVNVKTKGAKGDGKTDDTKAIQRAIDEVAGTGGTVYVPNGTYMVHTIGNDILHLGSKMTFRLADQAVIRAIPNDKKHYSVLKISGVSDVIVIGGTLQGDRRHHKGKKGEWGMGIFIAQKSARVTIVGVTARDMWGDGFYIKDGTDVAFCSVAAIHNRRQGLSIINAQRVLVTQSVFRDTRGTRPSMGIDLEPDRPEHSIVDVKIERSKFIDNAGGGITIQGYKGHVARVEIRHNVFKGTQPIIVKNAPGVRSTSICNNRYISQQEPVSEGFNAFAEPVEAVAFQMNCKEGSDMRFEKNRITKKKKK